MKNYIKVGYVKFVSQKNRKEIENELMDFNTEVTDEYIINNKTNQSLFSWNDGSRYPIVSVYSTDPNFLNYYQKCECRNITEISIRDSKNKLIFATSLFESNADIPTLINENTTDYYNLLKDINY